MHKKNKNTLQIGFGLIELMVSISIVVLVTSVILARHDSYNSAVLLRSQAYDIALKMREVQLQAVSAVGQGDEYRNVTGLYFNTTLNPNSYLVFVDGFGGGEKNFNYDLGEEIGKRENIDRRFELDQITLTGAGESTPQAVSIIFERPNFDARFYVDGDDEEVLGVTGVELGIRLKGSTDEGAGSLRTIEVSKTGQIIVQSVNSTPPNQIQDPIDPGGGGDDEGTKPGGGGGGSGTIDPGGGVIIEPGGGGTIDPGGGGELEES